MRYNIVSLLHTLYKLELHCEKQRRKGEVQLSLSALIDFSK